MTNAQAETLKVVGNDLFKAGQYADVIVLLSLLALLGTSQVTTSGYDLLRPKIKSTMEFPSVQLYVKEVMLLALKLVYFSMDIMVIIAVLC